eukprot:6492189-Amphidinium_carterae.4
MLVHCYETGLSSIADTLLSINHKSLASVLPSWFEFVSVRCLCKASRLYVKCQSLHLGECGIERCHNPQMHVVKKTGKRCGGPWHAFISMRTTGAKGKPRFSILAGQYRLLTSNDAALVKRVGQAARQAGLAGSARRSGISNFGPSSRAVARRREKEKKVALTQQAQQMQLSFQEKIAAWSTMHDYEAGHLKEFVKLCRRHMQLDTAQHVAQEQEMLDTLAKFEATMGAAHKEKVKHVLPACADVLDACTAVPLVGGVCLQMDPVRHAELAETLEWAGHTGSTSLAASLQTEWQQMHEPIIHEKSSPIHGEATTTKKCQEQGFCVCSGDGLKVLKLKQRLVTALRDAFKGKRKGNPLDSGSVVCSFTSPATTSNTIEGMAAKQIWVHVGLMYFKPLRPTFQLLYTRDVPVGEDATPDCQFLEAQHD